MTNNCDFCSPLHTVLPLYCSRARAFESSCQKSPCSSLAKQGKSSWLFFLSSSFPLLRKSRAGEFLAGTFKRAHTLQYSDRTLSNWLIFFGSFMDCFFPVDISPPGPSNSAASMTLLVHPSTDIIIIMMLYIIASSTSWSRNIPYDKDNAMLFYTAMNDVIHNTSSCQMPPARLTHGSLWNRGPHEKWLLLKNYRKDKRKGDRSSPMICVCLFPYFVALKVFHWFLLHDNPLRHYRYFLFP